MCKRDQQVKLHKSKKRPEQNWIDVMNKDITQQCVEEKQNVGGENKF